MYVKVAFSWYSYLVPFAALLCLSITCSQWINSAANSKILTQEAQTEVQYAESYVILLHGFTISHTVFSLPRIWGTFYHVLNVFFLILYIFNYFNVFDIF